MGSEQSTICRNCDGKSVYSRNSYGEWKHICHPEGRLPDGNLGGGAIMSEEKCDVGLSLQVGIGASKEDRNWEVGGQMH